MARTPTVTACSGEVPAGDGDPQVARELGTRHAPSLACTWPLV
ncbi:MAG: hypothetical protein ACRDNW_07280 [Trebonia sp.]